MILTIETSRMIYHYGPSNLKKCEKKKGQENKNWNYEVL